MPPTDELTGLAQGQCVGRRMVLGRVGAGAMGSVYAAYDPDLDRKVALKLLRRVGEPGARGEALEAEARALARLAHPHVASVYDVGRHAGQWFVVMEFVRGRNLEAWLSEEGSHWRSVLGVFRQAGAGLAAAHRAGLVHRDLKPSNVLVGDDGRVRVTDFGLALAGQPSAPPDPPGERVLAGTPAYMAPEQLRGGRADPRSDQFSYCACLYEALYGVRPFAGDEPTALIEAIERGRLQTPARSALVPAWLREAVLRGLAADPQRRHADLDALLRNVRPPAPRRRRWVGWVLLAGLAGGASVLWVWLQAEPRPGPTPGCGARTAVCLAQDLTASLGKAKLDRVAPSEAVLRGLSLGL